MKTTFRLLPTSEYDFVAMEAWFSAMAAEGLFFKSINTCGTFFTKGIPKRCTYRLEPLIDEPRVIPHKLNDLYGQFGWKFMGEFRGLYYIYLNEEEDVQEIHTDPVTYGMALERTQKKATNRTLDGLSPSRPLFFSYLHFHKQKLRCL